jgi:hypothetical protein
MHSRAWGSASRRSKLISAPHWWTEAELVRGLVQPAQRLVHVPEIAALLRSEEELFLPFHGVGALVRHVERIGGQVAVGGLQRRVERVVVVPQFFHHPGALFEQALFKVGEVLLVHVFFRSWSDVPSVGRPLS